MAFESPFKLSPTLKPRRHLPLHYTLACSVAMAEVATIPPLAIDTQPPPAPGPELSDISNSFVPKDWLPAPSQNMSPQSAHDPHRLPTFDSTTLISPPEPILYLPPLLSSLPVGYSHVPKPSPHYGHIDLENRLPEIDPLSLQLHKALHAFRPVTEEYSVTPYPKAFNWDELSLPEDAESEWYAVVFRSKRRKGSDGGREYSARNTHGHPPILNADRTDMHSPLRGRQACT